MLPQRALGRAADYAPLRVVLREVTWARGDAVLKRANRAAQVGAFPAKSQNSGCARPIEKDTLRIQTIGVERKRAADRRQGLEFRFGEVEG